MKRAFAPALVVLAALAVGCGGSVGSLLATVPPPVEFTAGGTGGLVELPAAGTYRGGLTVERVTMVKGQDGSWSQTEAVPTSTQRGQAEVTDRGRTVVLRGDAQEASLFRGTFEVVTAKPGRDAATYANLIAFDGHRERFDYLLTAGSPNTLRIVARAGIDQDGQTYRFDRYTFVLQP